MIPISRALRGRGDSGNPIPEIYKALEKVGARPRRGQMTLVAGGPGSGKTALVVNWIIKAGLPTAYISADTDASTLAERVSAQLLNKTVDEMEYHFAERDEVYERAIKAMADASPHVAWDFNRGPDLRSIEGSLEQFNYLNQEDPAIIVIDNLKNVYSDSDADANGEGHVRYNAVLDGLNLISGKTGACVIVLHHATGAYEDGYTPIPMSGILGKASKDFALILTVHRGGQYQNVSIVKNRSGKADPNGSLIAPIPFDPARMLYQEDYDPSDPNPPWHNVNLTGVAA